jgi:hypothetical protein
MVEPGEPQAQAVAVELLTLRLGPDGLVMALNHWREIEQDWGGNGHTTAAIGLLDLSIKLLYNLAQTSGVPEGKRTIFFEEYLRQHALAESQREDPWPGDEN